MEPAEETLLLNRKKFFNYVQKRVSDPNLAEDILQESLLKSLRSTDTLRDEERLLPWFYRILTNAIIDTYRKRNVEARYWEEYARETEGQEDAADQANLCECFRNLLPGLKPEYAELINRLDLEPGDPGQVAALLNIQPNNLKVRRYRARQALKQRLEEVCRTCAVHGCLDCSCQANGHRI